MSSFEFYDNIEVEFETVLVECDYGELGKKVYNAIRINEEEDNFLLTWENTKIKTYDDDFYDHVEFIDDGGEKRFIRAESDTLIEFLIDNDYPNEHRPMPERSWHLQMVELEAQMGTMALEEFLENN